MNGLSDLLLPCPFCGGTAERAVGQHNFRDVLIRCSACFAEGPLFDKDDASSAHENWIDAQRHWNSRTHHRNGDDTP